MTGVALILCACRRPQNASKKHTQNTSKINEKSMPEVFQKRVHKLLALSTLQECIFLDFQAQHGANMEPKGSQNGAKIDAKIDPEPKWRLGRASGRYKHPFGDHSRPILVPNRLHLRAHESSRNLQELPKKSKDYISIH